MPTGLREGLGGEQVNASGIGALTQNQFLLGHLQVTGSITAGTGVNLVTAGVTTTGSVVSTATNGFVAGVGSPYNTGLVVPLTARTIISGGMFVSASGGLAMSAPTSTLWPIGIATATAQSGATVNVLIQGIAPVIAEGTIAAGASCMMGAGAAQNCILAVTAASGIRKFGVLDAVASGGTVFIQL
jgi:hypothetical protein